MPTRYGRLHTLAAVAYCSAAFDLTVDYAGVLESAKAASSASEPPPPDREVRTPPEESPDASAAVAVAVSGELAELLTP